MLIYQTEDTPSRILNAISELGTPEVEEIFFQISYITRQGCRLLFNQLNRNIGANWQEIDKVFVTTLDHGITRPGALRYLLDDIPNSQVYSVNSPENFGRIFNPAPTFHPKIYSFLSDGTETSVVGSANLTESALTLNTEAISIIETPNVFENARNTLANLNVVNDDYIDAYRDFLDQQPRARVNIENPHQNLVRPQRPPNLLNEIDQHNIQLNQFNNFWLECGAMTSGGSRNQLELPRGSCRFFNFNFNNYTQGNVEPIGTPILHSGVNIWDNRPLRWHGNNMMERLNLPTVRQGGFDYANKIILFRRTNNNYEISVADQNSIQANGWLYASVRRNAVFQVSRNRICGFF